VYAHAKVNEAKVLELEIPAPEGAKYDISVQMKVSGLKRERTSNRKIGYCREMSVLNSKKAKRAADDSPAACDLAKLVEVQQVCRVPCVKSSTYYPLFTIKKPASHCTTATAYNVRSPPRVYSSFIPPHLRKPAYIFRTFKKKKTHSTSETALVIPCSPPRSSPYKYIPPRMRHPAPVFINTNTRQYQQYHQAMRASLKEMEKVINPYHDHDFFKAALNCSNIKELRTAGVNTAELISSVYDIQSSAYKCISYKWRSDRRCKLVQKADIAIELTGITLKHITA
jgi:hypothetical protein